MKLFLINLLTITNLVNPVNYPENNPLIYSRETCPTELTSLTEKLLKDLPSYSNRVIQRSRLLPKEINTFTYIIIAGNPEFEPLPLTHNQYNPNFEETTKQVFFTTLERRYHQNQLREVQNYHWLFLTYTNEGWKLVTLFSQLGSSQENRPPLPPQETSQGIIGQGIKLWLKDCQAGAIRS